MDIHSVVAGVLERGAGDTDVNFGSSCLSKHLDDLQGGGSADDRVVYEHYPLSFDDGLHWRELHLDSFLTERLCRKDEGTADVLALDESHFVRETAGFCVALGCAEAGIRNTDDDVCICRRLSEEDPAGFLAVVMHIAAFDVAVRAGEVHVLHRTHSVALRLSIELTADAVVVEGYDFAWLYIADIFSSEYVESAGLAGYDVAVAELSDCERMETVFVAAGIYTSTCHHDECKGSLKHIEGFLQGHNTWLGVVYALFLDQMGKHFRVR